MNNYEDLISLFTSIERGKKEFNEDIKGNCKILYGELEKVCDNEVDEVRHSFADTGELILNFYKDKKPYEGYYKIANSSSILYIDSDFLSDDLYKQLDEFDTFMRSNNLLTPFEDWQEEYESFMEKGRDQLDSKENGLVDVIKNDFGSKDRYGSRFIYIKESACLICYLSIIEGDSFISIEDIKSVEFCIFEKNIIVKQVKNFEHQDVVKVKDLLQYWLHQKSEVSE